MIYNNPSHKYIHVVLNYLLDIVCERINPSPYFFERKIPLLLLVTLREKCRSNLDIPLSANTILELRWGIVYEAWLFCGLRQQD
jgi:hypothetical protein